MEKQSIHLVTAEDLRKIRKKFGLTQRKLAKRAGVSQSLIARIENKSVDPRLSTIRKIINALTFLQKDIRTIKDVMHSPVVTIDALDTVRTAVNIMRKYDISQLPVLQSRIVIGSIQESTVINWLSRSRNVEKLFSNSVYNIMDKPFATVEPDMEVDTVVSLFSQGNSAILVMEKGKIIGIVTKIDILSSPFLKRGKEEEKI